MRDTLLPQGFDDAVQATNFWLYEIATRAGVQFEQGQYDYEQEDDRKKFSARHSDSGAST